LGLLPYHKLFHNFFLLRLAAKAAACVLGIKCPQRPTEGVASGPLTPAALPTAFSLNLVTKQVMKELVAKISLILAAKAIFRGSLYFP
jgi:hypothetical protein